MTKLRTIDAIALEKQRDVLLIVFPELHLREWLSQACIDVHPPRAKIIAWLEENGIAYEPCLGSTPAAAQFGSRPLTRAATMPLGNIYIDVPWDTNDATYQFVRSYLEDADGLPSIPNVHFCYYKFASAKLLQKLQSTNKTGNNVDEKV